MHGDPAGDEGDRFLHHMLIRPIHLDNQNTVEIDAQIGVAAFRSTADRPPLDDAGPGEILRIDAGLHQHHGCPIDLPCDREVAYLHALPALAHCLIVTRWRADIQIDIVDLEIASGLEIIDQGIRVIRGLRRNLRLARSRQRLARILHEHHQDIGALVFRHDASPRLFSAAGLNLQFPRGAVQERQHIRWRLQTHLLFRPIDGAHLLRMERAALLDHVVVVPLQR